MNQLLLIFDAKIPTFTSYSKCIFIIFSIETSGEIHCIWDCIATLWTTMAEWNGRSGQPKPTQHDGSNDSSHRNQIQKDFWWSLLSSSCNGSVSLLQILDSPIGNIAWPQHWQHLPCDQHLVFYGWFRDFGSISIVAG